MKIFTAAQIRACDAYSIHASSISSADLMERAAAQCVDWITAQFPKDALFVVLCGTGNNGGDGLAITRMLHRLGYGAKAFLIRFSAEMSKDCSYKLQQLQNLDPSLVNIVPPDTFITDIPEHIIIIDAILGGSKVATVDSGAYYEGYMPVVMLHYYAKYGIPPSSIPIGGTVIDASNAELVKEFAGTYR